MVLDSQTSLRRLTHLFQLFPFSNVWHQVTRKPMTQTWWQFFSILSKNIILWSNPVLEIHNLHLLPIVQLLKRNQTSSRLLQGYPQTSLCPSSTLFFVWLTLIPPVPDRLLKYLKGSFTDWSPCLMGCRSACKKRKRSLELFPWGGRMRLTFNSSLLSSF